MQIKAMRDIFLASLYEKMKTDKTIFFIVADFGAPILDKIREDYFSSKNNLSLRELAKKHRISPSSIIRIINYQTW